MGITHAFVSARSDGSDPTQVQPSHWNAEHVIGESGLWEEAVTKSSDQSANSTTLVSDTELIMAVTAGSIWRFEIDLLYSGTGTTCDYKWALNVSTGSMTGWHRYAIITPEAIGASSGIRDNALATTASVALATDASDGQYMGLIEAQMKFTASADFRFQFAQNTSSGSQVAKTRAGSVLRATRML